MSTSKFFSDESSPVKRELSVYEKGSIPSVNGKALVFPAEPGTEVEELVEVGVDPSHIVGIDRDAQIAAALREYYMDLCPILHIEMQDLIDHTMTPHQYCYVHADPCGCFTQELNHLIQTMPKLLKGTGRVRITAFDPKRHPHVRAYEAQVVSSIIGSLCEIGYNHSKSSASKLHAGSWAKYYAQLESPQTSHAIFAALLCGFFFGKSSEEVVDKLSKHELPVAHGGHVFSRIESWKYKEASTSNYMTTTWVDLKPFPANAVRNSDEWVLGYIQYAFKAALDLTPVYDSLAIIERPF